jgi:tetratricopeptide (TPR) repeat protein
MGVDVRSTQEGVPPTTKGEKLTPAMLMLGMVQPEEAELLRRCAIPFQFSYRLLRTMSPDESREQIGAAARHFVKLSVVRRSADGFAMHDRVREALLSEWLADNRLAEFRRINGLLAAYLRKRLRLRTSSPSRYEMTLRSWIYHLTAANEERGFQKFEQCLEYYRENLRLTAADNLLRMISEYEKILTAEHKVALAYDRAKVAAARGNNKAAREALRLVILDKHTTDLLRARAYNRLGLVYDALREWPKAIDSFCHSLELLAKTVGGDQEMPRVLRNLGVVYRDTGNLARAEELFVKSCEAAEKIGDREEYAAARNALGTVHQRCGEYEKATVCFLEALNGLAPESFDRARVYNNLGIVAMEAQRWDSSEKYFQTSLKIKRQAADTIGQAYTHMNLVRLYRAQNETAKAIASAAAAAGLFEELSDSYNAAFAYLNLARLYVEDDPEKAREASKRACEALRAAGDERESRAAERELALLLGKKNRSPWFWLTLIFTAPFVLLIICVILYLVVIMGLLAARP